MEVARSQARALAPALVLVAVGLLVLLAFNLRNLDAGSEQLPPPLTTEEPPSEAVPGGAGDALRTLYLTFLVVLTAIVVIGLVLMVLKGEKLRSIISVWEILGYLVGAFFLIAALLYWPQFTAALDNAFRGVTGGGSAPTPGTPGSGTRLTVGTPGAWTLLLAVLLIGTFLLVFAIGFLPRLYGIATDEPATAWKRRKALALAMDRAIQDLEAGGDFRAAVLRCYRSMILLFESHGLRADPSQTAREFEADALAAAGVSREGIDDLTSLFEEARYSTHPIGAAQRDAAIACLSTIRGQLELST
ncbi:MAG: DUF4129 domain-containing protein [Methanobacteriota archaeon]|nr:MAG: DUF4129 domain-containing protein [Euryarchaeota archaeon]